MSDDRQILIKNIYYMLSYAYRVLKQTNYREIASEDFENIHDLLAAILSKGIVQQLKQGLVRDYIPLEEELSVLRGKLRMYDSLHLKMQRKMQMACVYDEYSENILFNRILKTTALMLLRHKRVKRENKSKLKSALLMMEPVETLNPSSIPWNRLHFRRNTQNYRMLMYICYFVLDGLLLSTDEGKFRIAEFSDDHMHSLYERFILEYYRHHYPQLKPSAPQISWALEDGEKDHLPQMQTDITLRLDDRALIIDAKYYGRTMQSQYNKQTIHSANLYQIFSYVKNMEATEKVKVDGMLLYAKTQEAVTPDGDYVIAGNRISVKTLDLNRPFVGIEDQLKEIANRFVEQ